MKNSSKEVTYLQERNGIKYEVNQEKPFTGKYVRYWTKWFKDVEKREEVNFVVGKEEGLWIEWHKNGQKKLEKHYKDGEEEGR